MKTEKKTRFSIDSIEEEEFYISEQMPELSAQIVAQSLQETDISLHDEIIKVRSGIRYSIESKVVCSCIISIRFHLFDLDSWITIHKGQKSISITSDFMPTLLNITYGALRGALFERTKGTTMEKYPLPLLSMDELIKLNHFFITEP